jgi:hypothetical protein
MPRIYIKAGVIPALGLDVVNESPEFFGNAIRSDHEKYGQLIEAIGFQPQ